MIVLEQEQKSTTTASIKVIGVGGAGGNTVNSIIDSGYAGIEFIVANTDAQALELSKAAHKIQIGQKSTKGLGTGANPELGRRAAEEDLDKVMEAVHEADIVFLTGGMGGGTGSGALPVIAQALRERGVLTIAIVTKPFHFEGRRRTKIAQEAIEVLKKQVDTLIVIPNEKLLEVVDEQVSMIDAFAMINDVLCQSVGGLSDIIAKPGHINVDFADVKTIMHAQGLAVMGTGKAAGQNRAKEAAWRAISSPLLENMSIKGAHGVLLNITGGPNLTLREISQAAEVVYEQADEDAQIIIGSVIDNSLDEDVTVTIIATGFESEEEKPERIGDYSKDEMKIRPTTLDTSEREPAMQMVQEEKREEKEEVSKAYKEVKKEEKMIAYQLHQLKKSEMKKEAEAKKEELVCPEQTVALLEKVQQEQEEELLMIDGESELDVPTFMRKKSERVQEERE